MKTSPTAFLFEKSPLKQKISHSGIGKGNPHSLATYSSHYSVPNNIKIFQNDDYYLNSVFNPLFPF